MNSGDFVHLHCHSDFSFLDGAAKVENLVKAAKKAGHTALALTDHGSMSGAIEFWKACNAEGIKPIIGIEAYLAPGLDENAHTRRAKDEDGKDRIDPKTGRKQSFDYNHFTLLAKNFTGLKNLYKLSSEASINGFYYRPRMSWSLLKERHEGIIALSGCLSGEPAEEIKKGNEELARQHARRWRGLFGDDYYMELMPAWAPEQAQVNDACLRIAKDLGAKCVATTDVHYVNPGDADVQEVKICVANHKTLAENRETGLNMKPVFFYKSTDEVAKDFTGYEHVLMTSREIADKVEKIEGKDIVPGKHKKYFMPKFVPPDGSKPLDFFKRLANAGLIERYGLEGAKLYQAKLDFELDVIDKSGFVEYLLVVWDYINWARTNGVPVGPGRGSCAGSIACYCIGITNIDPVRYDLLFERFMNPARVSMPDIDTDFCLAGSTKIIDAHTGRVKTLDRLFEESAKPAVFAVGEDLKVNPRRSGGVVRRGKKPVFRLLTTGGRAVVATSNHRFMTGSGWTKLSDLKPGDMVATSRAFAVTGTESEFSRLELSLLAGIVSEGNTTSPSEIILTQKLHDSASRALMREWEEAASSFQDTFTKRRQTSSATHLSISSGPDWRSAKFSRLPELGGSVSIQLGTSLKEASRLLVLETLKACHGNKILAARILGTSPTGIYSRITSEDQKSVRVTPLRSGAFLWAERLGLIGLRSHQKRLPDEVNALSDEECAFLVGRLWSGDGCLRRGVTRSPSYTTISIVLAEQVRTLLLRLGIASSVYVGQKYRTKSGEVRSRYSVTIVGDDSLAAFCARILPHFLGSSSKKKILIRYAAERQAGLHVNALSDPVPASIVEPLLDELGVSRRQLAEKTGVHVRRFSGDGRTWYGRRFIYSAARAVKNAALLNVGDSDVYWDRVSSITPAGAEETYDIIDVETDKNFALANGLFAHNCERGRHRVFEYVKQKYGEECVGQIITFGENKAKSSIRDVARTIGVDVETTNKIARMIPDGPKVELADCLRDIDELKKAGEEDLRVGRVLNLALQLEGFYRNPGRHAAAVVIGDTDLRERIPLTVVGSKNNRGVCTAFSMKDVEDVGLVKMDLLGLRTLTQIYDTLDLIYETTGRRIEEDRIPVRDSKSMTETAGDHVCWIHDRPFSQCQCCDKTLRILCEAESNGVFQVESPGMKNLLKQMKPDRFDDLIAICALFRPGPLGSGMDQTYVRRKNGEERFVFAHPPEKPTKGDEGMTYEHPALEPVMNQTYGVFCYQEQLMQLSVVLAGFTMPQADELRRATGKKDAAGMTKIGPNFIKGCMEKSAFTEEKAKALWEQIAHFSEYSFNKSHSAAYGLISWHTAWLKANFPLEFFAALMTSSCGNTDTLARYVDEAMRWSIEVLPPDVNTSAVRFSVVRMPEGSLAISYGLEAVKGVSTDAALAIVQARKKVGRFRSALHFFESVNTDIVGTAAAESLAYAGAFLSTGANRAQLLTTQKYYKGKKVVKEIEETPLKAAAVMARQSKKEARTGQTQLFDAPDPETEAEMLVGTDLMPDIPEWSRRKIAEAEKESVGFYLTTHPLQEYMDVLQEYVSVISKKVRDMKAHARDHVIMGGLVVGMRTIIDKKGNEMAFVSVEDLSGPVDGRIFARTWVEVRRKISIGAVIFMAGELDEASDPPSMRVDRVWTPEEVPKEIPRGRSLFMQLRKGAVTEVLKNAILDVLKKNPGDMPVFWAYQGELELRRCMDQRTSGTHQVRQELRNVLGGRGEVAYE